MKYCLPTILTAALFIACNSGKKKTVTENDMATDTATIKNTVSADTNYQANAVADTVPVPANRLIIPGKSIGLTSIDQKHTEAMKHLGDPATSDAAMGGKEMSTWYSKPVIHGTDTVINETEIFFATQMGEETESRVRHIRITSGFFATASHIGTGSKQDSVQKYFPGMKRIASYISPKTKKEVIIYDDNQSGIAFEMDDQHRCIGITVHKAGDLAYETYNALFGDVNFDQYP